MKHQQRESSSHALAEERHCGWKTGSDRRCGKRDVVRVSAQGGQTQAEVVLQTTLVLVDGEEWFRCQINCQTHTHTHLSSHAHTVSADSLASAFPACVSCDGEEEGKGPPSAEKEPGGRGEPPWPHTHRVTHDTTAAAPCDMCTTANQWVTRAKASGTRILVSRNAVQGSSTIGDYDESGGAKS